MIDEARGTAMLGTLCPGRTGAGRSPGEINAMCPKLGRGLVDGGPFTGSCGSAATSRPLGSAMGAVRAALWIVCLARALPGGGPVQAEEGLPRGFVAGEFVVVGREPDGGAVYAGWATIEVGSDGDRAPRAKESTAEPSLRLTRRLAEGRHPETVEVFVGGFESAAGGDIEVVRFRGPMRAAGAEASVPGNRPRQRTITCQVAGDLDNYPRLTCLWTFDDEPGVRQPGLEAFFATGAWP